MERPVRRTAWCGHDSRRSHWLAGRRTGIAATQIIDDDRDALQEADRERATERDATASGCVGKELDSSLLRWRMLSWRRPSRRLSGSWWRRISLWSLPERSRSVTAFVFPSISHLLRASISC